MAAADIEELRGRVVLVADAAVELVDELGTGFLCSKPFFLSSSGVEVPLVIDETVDVGVVGAFESAWDFAGISTSETGDSTETAAGELSVLLGVARRAVGGRGLDVERARP